MFHAAKNIEKFKRLLDIVKDAFEIEKEEQAERKRGQRHPDA